MAKKDRKPLKNKYKQRKLKGTPLLLRLQAVTGSTSLDNFNGSIKELAIQCGYVPDQYRFMPVQETVRRNIKQFVYEYHKAKRTNAQKGEKLILIDDVKLEKLLSYSNPRRRSEHIKLDDLVEKQLKPRTRNSPQRRTLKVNSNFEDEIINGKINNFFNDEVNDESKAEQSEQLQKITGVSLVKQAIKLDDMGESEINICQFTGYKKVETFRIEFAKNAAVEIAPLRIMIRALKQNPFWVKFFKEENKEIEEFSFGNQTSEYADSGDPFKEQIQELIESEKQFIESDKLFIDREKITSEVKRTYRNPKFRKKVLEKYGSNCCCCDIAIETLIEAAHIVPVENKGNDDVSNGIPLCPTHHTAFDNFLFTINPTDNSIIYKEGLSSEDLQITKTKCKIKVSKESLEYRYKLFNQ